MGAGQSVQDGRPPPRGLHVLRVTPSSPASRTNLEPFFDFIVGYEADGVARRDAQIEAHDFEEVVEQYEGRKLYLMVWSSKTQSLRHVPIVPSRAWSQGQSGEGDGKAEPNSQQPSLLGLSMRICEPEFALDNVWHVMDVLEGSPAESAGLVPYGDWIVGWSGGILGAEGDFYDLVEAHEDKPLRVYVYSYDFNTLREVVLVPNRQWGGEGLLGCVFGYGLLHRIPVISEDEPVPLDDDYDTDAVFVPADHIEEDAGEGYGAHNGTYGIYSEPGPGVDPAGPYGLPQERRTAPPRPGSAASTASYQRNGTMPPQDSRHYLDPPIAPVEPVASPP